MRLLHYVFTNTVTVRGFLRKGFLWCAGLLLVGCVGLYIRANSFLSPSSIQGFLASDDIKQGLESAIFLQTGEYVSIQEDTIFSNKTGAWFSGDDTVTYQDLGSCEEVFNNNLYSDNAVVIIPSGICIVNDNKQQVVTVKQLREVRSTMLSELGSGLNTGLISTYPVLASLFSGNIVRIDNTVLTKIVHSEIPTLFADNEFLDVIDSIVSLSTGWMMIPLYIIGLFLIVGILLIIAVIRMIYSLATWAIATILKKPINSFEQACSISRLPLLLLSLIADTAISLPWWGDILLFCVIMVILMHIYYISPEEGKRE